jgi:rhamnulokinase
LANDYARTIKQLEAITHLDYANLYVVGGGRKNLYLNRLIEEKTGKHVVLGSGEATSLGNVALQALCQKDVANYDEMKQMILLEEDK